MENPNQTWMSQSLLMGVSSSSWGYLKMSLVGLFQGKSIYECQMIFINFQFQKFRWKLGVPPWRKGSTTPRWRGTARARFSQDHQLGKSPARLKRSSEQRRQQHHELNVPETETHQKWSKQQWNIQTNLVFHCKSMVVSRIDPHVWLMFHIYVRFQTGILTRFPNKSTNLSLARWKS